MNNAPVTEQLSRPTDDLSTPDSITDTLVLLVDDTVDNLVLISIVLQQKGYRVVTASNGEEAVRAALLSHPDIILMDIGMPRLDGFGAARKIKEYTALAATPIIAVTAFDTDGFRRAAYDVGFDGYLTKPLDFERLDKLIRDSLPAKPAAAPAEEHEEVHTVVLDKKIA